MSMQTVTFNCEVVTPMFLGSADPNKPELRPPSIRGAMRWWFRAMMGGLIGSNYDELKKLESLVFGNTDTGSAINVRIKRKTNGQLTIIEEQPRLPHKTTEREKAKRNAIVQGEFDIELSLRPGVRQHEGAVFESAKHSLILLLVCGGLGTRSRRGFGCVTFSINGNDYASKSIKDVIGEARTASNSLLSAFSISLAGWGNATPPFPCIAEDCFEIWTANANANWLDELKRLMNTMSDFKSNESFHKYAIGDVIIHTPHRLSSPLIVHARKVSFENVQLVFSHFRTKPLGQITISKTNSDALDTFLQNNIGITKVGVFL